MFQYIVCIYLTVNSECDVIFKLDTHSIFFFLLLLLKSFRRMSNTPNRYMGNFYTQLSGTLFAISIFLIACTLISKSTAAVAVCCCCCCSLLQLLPKYEPSSRSCEGTFVVLVADFKWRFFGRLSCVAYFTSY